MSTPLIVISPDKIAINNRQFEYRVPVGEYCAVLEDPIAVDDGLLKSPMGYRNPRWYFFACGVYLVEDHITRTISAMNVVFDPSRNQIVRARSQVLWRTFSGELLLGRFQVSHETLLGDVLRSSELPLQPHLGYLWYHDGPLVSINIHTFRAGGSRNVKKRHIHSISCGFRNADDRLKQAPANETLEDEAIFQWLIETAPLDQRALLHTLSYEERARMIDEYRHAFRTMHHPEQPP